MKIFVLAILIIFPFYLVKAQVLKVTSLDSGKPLEMVSIISNKPYAVALTNARGNADISAFCESNRIEIRILSYETEILSYAELDSVGFELKLISSYFNLDEIVISANKWEQVSSNIPEKIISIKASDLQISNPQTTPDLLSASGKVFVQKSQMGGGSPMIRGFATNRLLYTIDGVRMNTAIFRSGNIHNLISLDPLSIDRTEVLFGPGSVIYGSDAIGGVMSFTTIIPQFTLDEKPLSSGSVQTRFSSANNERLYHFHINLGWKKWAFVTSVSSSKYDDLKMGSFGPDEYLCPYFVVRQDSMDIVSDNNNPKVQKPSAYSQLNFMQKIRFKPNNKWDFNYGFHYSATSDYGRFDRHIRNNNGVPLYGEWYYGPQKWMMNNINITNYCHNVLYDEITFRIAHQFFEESRISRDFNQAEREHRIEKVNAFSGNLDFHKQTTERNSIYYGLEFVFDNVNSEGINENIDTGISQVGPSRYPDAGWFSYAAYITDRFNLTPNLNMQTGLRYSRYVLNAVFDTNFYPIPYTDANLNNGALTGSFGIVYNPSDDWILSTNLSTAYRSPNVDDVGKVFDSEPGAVVVPNTNLKAEYAYNIDISVAHVFSKSVKFDLTAYYTYLDNAMVRRDFVINGQDSIFYDGELSKVQAMQNAAFANVFGIQAGLEIKLPANLSISADFNYQKGTEELDDGTVSPARHAPPFFGNVELKYSFNKVKLMLYTVFCGKKTYENMPLSEIAKDYLYASDTNGNPYSPAWYTLNFKAMYQFDHNFSISAGVENITDQRYRTYSSGIAAPGRNFIISLKASF